ncbi:MAG: hypothetical protein ABI354_02640 [Candidatus Saccharimonadales bacterium]
MLTVIISCILGGLVVLGGELLRKRGSVSNETSRKLTHMAHGLVVASWCYGVGYGWIIAAEVVFLISVVAARRLGLFKAMRQVNRSSWGDVLFPLAVIAIAATNPSNILFAATLVILGLADGLAALVGQNIKSYHYKAFNQDKSLAGTATFWIVSFLVTYLVLIKSGVRVNDISTIFVLVTIPSILSFMENVSPYGTDNFTVPLMTMLLLSQTIG